MTRPDDIEIYRDLDGRYRWHRVASNGRIISDSGQSYRTYWGCKRAAVRVNGKLPVYDMRIVAPHSAGHPDNRKKAA
jgi:uncharacterized protein YegP (UPF0339 family)